MDTKSKYLINTLGTLINNIQSVYLACTTDNNSLFENYISSFRVANIIYWIPIIWKILHTTNENNNYYGHTDTRRTLILCLKHYDILFNSHYSEAIITTETGIHLFSKIKLNELNATFSSASINYPLYESLYNAIIQYKRRVKKPLVDSYQRDISKNNSNLLNIEEILPLDNTIFNNLTSAKSIEIIRDNLFTNYRNYFFKNFNYKDDVKNFNSSLASLIKCILWNRISIMFFIVIVFIFILECDNPPALNCEPFINDMFKSKLRIKDKNTINNILYFCNEINDIFINCSSSNKEQLDNSLNNRISPKDFMELYDEDINLKPYCKFPVFDYDHISQILCNKLNYSNKLKQHIFKYLKNSGSKLNVNSFSKNTFKTARTYKIIVERNLIPKSVNNIAIKGFIPKIPTKKTLKKQLTAVSRLCNFETFSKYNSNSEFSPPELNALVTLKSAFSYKDDFTYKTFIDFFEPKELSNINELLIYELLKIDLKDRHLDKLLNDLYGIEFRDTLMSIKHMTLECFSDYDNPITDTSYTITKVKFANALIKKFKAKDCQNFLGDIRNFDKSKFKIFIEDFCKSQNIIYPYFKDDSEFIKYVFSTVLDLSIIELEHEFNKFWQYDFSMSYCKKSDIKPNSILKGVYRNSKK